jgi:hypothetical protein
VSKVRDLKTKYNSPQPRIILAQCTLEAQFQPTTVGPIGTRSEYFPREAGIWGRCASSAVLLGLIWGISGDLCREHPFCLMKLQAEDEPRTKKMVLAKLKDETWSNGVHVRFGQSFLPFSKVSIEWRQIFANPENPV